MSKDFMMRDTLDDVSIKYKWHREALWIFLKIQIFEKHNKQERPLRDVGLKHVVISHFAPFGTVWYPNFQQPKMQLQETVTKTCQKSMSKCWTALKSRNVIIIVIVVIIIIIIVIIIIIIMIIIIIIVIGLWS